MDAIHQLHAFIHSEMHTEMPGGTMLVKDI